MRTLAFEYERTRIIMRINDTIAGILFMQGEQPYLHFVRGAHTEGIGYYISRVLSASQYSAEIQYVPCELKS